MYETKEDREEVAEWERRVKTQSGKDLRQPWQEVLFGVQNDRCWADGDLNPWTQRRPKCILKQASELGLCAKHYKEITGREPPGADTRP